MELVSVLMSMDGEQVLLVLIYQPPAENQWKIKFFIEELTAQPEELDIGKHNTIVLRDFNLDQMYDPYIDWFNDILTCFASTQHSNYYTDSYEGIFDLFFHNRKETPVEWLPMPYSDHFVLLIAVWEPFWNHSIEKIVNCRTGKEE